MTGLTSACRSNESSAPATNNSSEIESSAPPELAYTSGSDLGEDERGGTTVVMLHGYGASADDLVALARTLFHPRTRYIVPAGPIELTNGGRAWWAMSGRTHYDEDQVVIVPMHRVEPARAAVLALLAKLHQRFAPRTLVLLGFSQGAMLALDVALAARAGVARVAVLSGALLDDALQQLKAGKHASPSVFVSHGRQDPILKFAGAERLVEALKQQDVRTHFHAFEGGHEIPDELTDDLRAFVSGES